MPTYEELWMRLKALISSIASYEAIENPTLVQQSELKRLRRKRDEINEQLKQLMEEP